MNSAIPVENTLNTERNDKIIDETIDQTNSPELFKIELYDALNRYYSDPELEIALNLKDPNGNKIDEHIGLNATYNEWKGIQSVWDRRSVLYKSMDSTELKKLEKWQIVERFVKDRYSIKATEFIRSNVTDDDFQDIRLILACSKLFRTLDDFESALFYAKRAFAIYPKLDIVKAEYANVLHLSKNEKDKKLAHQLMNELLEKRINETEENKFDLFKCFLFSKNYIDSSVFAAIFLQQADCDLETWDIVAEEYYWCPLFRYEHSLALNRKGESLRSIAKLNSLANEFPWFKLGVLANIDSIKQLREQMNDQNYMSDELKQMEKYKSQWEN